jgi:hypothetical protein
VAAGTWEVQSIEFAPLWERLSGERIGTRLDIRVSHGYALATSSQFFQRSGLFCGNFVSYIKLMMKIPEQTSDSAQPIAAPVALNPWKASGWPGWR